MSFVRPSITELISRMQQDAQSRMSVQQLRRSNANVYVRTGAGAVHGVYGYAEYLARQILPDTAEAEFLDRHASIFGILRKQAEKASGTVRLRFSSSLVPIPVGTFLQADGGVLFRTTADAVLITGVSPVQATVAVEAVEAGSAGNQTQGDVITLLSPIAGVESEATIVAVSGGSDAEDDESLRARIHSRTTDTPHGGAASDYVQWALEVPGVTRAWCYPREDGEGSVTVRFVCDGNPMSIIPDEAMLARVAEYLETVRPVTADVYVWPPHHCPKKSPLSARRIFFVCLPGEQKRKNYSGA